jgi:hypothetical protein
MYDNYSNEIKEMEEEIDQLKLRFLSKKGQLWKELNGWLIRRATNFSDVQIRYIEYLKLLEIGIEEKDLTISDALALAICFAADGGSHVGWMKNEIEHEEREKRQKNSNSGASMPPGEL